MSSLTAAERAKLSIFANGVGVSPAARARLYEATGGHAATPADYASTSGLILVLESDTWVNAPIVDYNRSFVDRPAYELDWDSGSFCVRSAKAILAARVWLPPVFHHERNLAGDPYTNFGYTHSDRLRISPVEGCSMTCKFCDLPYTFRYRTKAAGDLIETVERALVDPVQPAGHVLISGGTPIDADVGYLHDVYETILGKISHVPVDIMMVPLTGLLDPAWVAISGVNELSVNIELINDDAARRLMPNKRRLGLEWYLDYLAEAASHLGPDRVRSMLMVGVEPIEDTLRGVRLVAERGCVPVLSPFRPDPSTPLRDRRPPDESILEEVYLRAMEITSDLGTGLGPNCVPCTHNTLTFAASGSGTANRWHAVPMTV